MNMWYKSLRATQSRCKTVRAIEPYASHSITWFRFTTVCWAQPEYRFISTCIAVWELFLSHRLCLNSTFVRSARFLNCLLSGLIASTEDRLMDIQYLCIHWVRHWMCCANPLKCWLIIWRLKHLKLFLLFISKIRAHPAIDREREGPLFICL